MVGGAKGMGRECAHIRPARTSGALQRTNSHELA